MLFAHGGELWVMPIDPGGRPTGEPSLIVAEPAAYPSVDRHGKLLFGSRGELRTRTPAGAMGTVPLLDFPWHRDVPPPAPATKTVKIHAGALWDGRSDQLQHAATGVDFELY